MSYTSSDPEYLNRDPDTSSIASTSTVTTSSSQQSTKKKKPWSKFKSSIKSIGEKMSSRPKFTDPTESSEQKRVKKGKKGKAGQAGNSSGEPKSSTPEEPTRSKSPTKNLMRKFSVETISTPFVGYQPASVTPGPKSYAKALHKSGSTSESNLSASDMDTPRKSLTLDRNLKLAESPDSGRASQTMGSIEGSRPPSQIKEVSSDVSVDSDYTSPQHGGLEEKGLDDLVTKTEQFAQSLSPKAGKEKDTDVSVEFLKAETVVNPPTNVSSKSDTPLKPEDKQEKIKDNIESPSQNVKEEKNKVSNLEDEGKVGTKPSEDEVDRRKKRGSDSRSKKEDPSLGFINSERSTVPDPVKPVSSETKQPEKEDAGESKTPKSLESDLKPEKSKEKEQRHDRKETKSNREDKDKVSKETEGADKSTKPEAKPVLTNETKDTTDKQDKSESKPVPELKPESKEKPEKTPATTPKDENPAAEPAKKEDPKPNKPENDAEKSALSKTPSKTPDVPSPLTDVGPATPQTGMSVEEKLQAFLAAEGWSGTTKDVPVRSGAEGSTQPDKRECLYKILVIGELGTGKTSIIKRYVHQFFSQHYRATIGVDFALKVLNWDQNTIIRLQLWDIAGQERFGNMTRVYYKEAVGAFIVFDVTRSATFDAVLKWKQDLDSKVQLADGSHIPCVLLANKCDQQKEGIVNTPAKMDEYCKENNFSAWFETSAKENINIDEAAKCLVTQILQNDKSSQNGRDSARDGGKFPLDGKSEQESKSCAC